MRRLCFGVKCFWFRKYSIASIIFSVYSKSVRSELFEFGNREGLSHASKYILEPARNICSNHSNVISQKSRLDLHRRKRPSTEKSKERLEGRPSKLHLHAMLWIKIPKLGTRNNYHSSQAVKIINLGLINFWIKNGNSSKNKVGY